MKPYDSFTTAERTEIHCAIGRLLRIMSRPEQPGDKAEYYRMRSLIMDRLQGEEAQPVLSKPHPGWNFGSGVSGVIE